MPAPRSAAMTGRTRSRSTLAYETKTYDGPTLGMVPPVLRISAYGRHAAGERQRLPDSAIERRGVAGRTQLAEARVPKLADTVRSVALVDGATEKRTLRTGDLPQCLGS